MRRRQKGEEALLFANQPALKQNLSNKI